MLINILNNFRNVLGVFSFFYIYEIFFNNCNQKLIVRTKNKKKKSVLKSKIGLSLTYFIVLSFLFYTFTIKIILTLFFVISLVLLYCLDKYDENKLKFIGDYDSNKILRYFWKVFYIIMQIVFFMFKPFSKILNSYINDNYSSIKNKLSENFFNNFDDENDENDLFNMFKDNLIDKEDIKENVKLDNQKETCSSMSAYIINDKNDVNENEDNNDNENNENNENNDDNDDNENKDDNEVNDNNEDNENNFIFANQKKMFINNKIIELNEINNVTLSENSDLSDIILEKNNLINIKNKGNINKLKDNVIEGNKNLINNLNSKLNNEIIDNSDTLSDENESSSSINFLDYLKKKNSNLDNESEELINIFKEMNSIFKNMEESELITTPKESNIES